MRMLVQDWHHCTCGAICAYSGNLPRRRCQRCREYLPAPHAREQWIQPTVDDGLLENVTTREGAAGSALPPIESSRPDAVEDMDMDRGRADATRGESGLGMARGVVGL